MTRNRSPRTPTPAARRQRLWRRAGAALASALLTLLLFDGVAGLARPGADPAPTLAIVHQPLR